MIAFLERFRSRRIGRVQRLVGKPRGGPVSARLSPCRAFRRTPAYAMTAVAQAGRRELVFMPEAVGKRVT